MERIDRIEAGILALQESQARNEAIQAKASADLNAQIAKTEAQMAHNEAIRVKASAELDAQLAKTDAQLAEYISKQTEYEAQRAKNQIQYTKTDEKLKEIGIRLGNMGVNLGIVAEEFFYYSLKEKMKLGKMKFDQIDINLKGRKNELYDEFDIVMYNGKSIALIEIKLKVHPNDINTLKTKKVHNFKTIFPHYADYQVYLGIGGYSIPTDIENLATQNGIAVLRQKGEIAEILDKNLIAY